MAKIAVRREMPGAELSRDEFAKRFARHFDDPAFDALQTEIARVTDVAWDAYADSRKSPRTRKAGEGYADPDYDLSIEWIEASRAVRDAERRQKDPGSPSRILLINGATRSEHTCPGESSKTFRLTQEARGIFAGDASLEIDFLDLSRLASEYGRIIYPCKTCVSTAMPLCHWPCSCYPNHSLDQVGDWMNEIYPMWVAAHGIMIVCPVNWYGAPSSLKLMIDRLVCADGGNPDPTSTHGKDPEKAKEIELAGWPYPRHLSGRVFSVIVHGDSVGAETVMHALADWLRDMGLIEAGNKAALNAYVGYKKPYATSHDDLDQDDALREEVRNAARALVGAVKLMREGKFEQPDADLREPRPK
jgi:multimeric flavodoxin WrbA